MRLTAHQPAYLPGPRLLHKLASCDAFVLLDHLPWSHGSFEARNKIRTAQGEQWLSVPVLHGAQAHADMLVAPGNWTRKHYRAIEMNYARANYWPGIKDDIAHLYARLKEEPRIVEVCEMTLEPLFLELVVGGHHDYYRSSEMETSGSGWEMLLGLCNSLGATEFLFGGCGRGYMTEQATRAFLDAGVKPLYQTWHVREYRQCYEPFMGDMSALDILLNLGPHDGAELVAQSGGWAE